MELQQLINNWTKEMAELKVEIQDYENETGKSAISAEARLQAISEILADVRQLNLPPVSNSLPDFRDVIEARIKFFNANYHTYEGSKLQNALNTIRRLVPPILFQIGQ